MKSRAATPRSRSRIVQLIAPMRHWWNRPSDPESARATVEILESRIAPAATVSISSGNLIVAGSAGSDSITISSDGTNVIVSDLGGITLGAGVTNGDPTTAIVPFVDFTGSIQVTGALGDDALTIDLSDQSPFPLAGISFDGGGQTTGDSLVISSGAQGTVTYNYTNANDGSIVMSNYGTLTYTGLEPITNSGSASDVIFNLPAGPNTVTLGDDGTSGNTLSRLSGATFEDTDFANPSGTVTIVRGNAADTITVNALPDLSSSITLGSGGSPFASINFAGAVTLSGGNLDAYASGTVSLGGSAAVATSGSGTISLTTARDIAFASGASLSAAGGAVTLHANTAGTTAGDFDGILIAAGASVSSTSGAITLHGDGGASDATGNQGGVKILGTVQTNSGAISITGDSGNSSGATVYGILLDGGVVQALAGGTIALTGTSAGSGTGAAGVHLDNGATVKTSGAGGTITIGGTGSGGGSGAANAGVQLSNASKIVNDSSAAIGITAVAGAGSSAFVTAGSGPNRIGYDGVAAYSGSIAIDANTVALSNHNVTTTGSVTFKQTTAGTAISLAGASTLDLTDGELDGVTAGTIVIGDSSSGALTIGGAITRATATNLTFNAGANSVSFTGGGGIDAAGGTVTFNSGAITGSTGTEITSSGGALVLNTSGAVSLDTAVADLGASTVTSGTITIANTGALSVSGALSFTGDLSLSSTGTLTIAANLSKASGGSANVVLAAVDDVRFTSGADLAVSAGAVTTTLNSDTDANLAGGVWVQSGSTLTTNSGALTIGGGSSPASTETGYLLGGANFGVIIQDAISTGAGNVSIRGHGRDGGGSSASGFELASGASISTTTGNITLQATGGSASTLASGVLITGSTVQSTSGGTISITGSAQTALNSAGIAITGTVKTTGAGTITLSGTGAADAGAGSHGVSVTSSGQITVAGSGAISITGAGGSSASGLSISTGANRIGFDGTNAYSGAITINADSVALANHTIQTTGGVTIQPSTASTAISFNGASTLDLTTSELTGISAATLTIGSASGTGAISIGATNLSGTNYNLAVRGGAAAFSGGLTLAASKTATFTTAGITGSGSTDLTSSGGTLVLNTTGAVTMQTAIANLGASTVSSGAVNVSNTGSLTVSGAIDFTGDLTLASGGTLTIGANLGKSSGGASTTTLRAANGVVFNASTALTSSSGAMAVTLNGDSDANSQGPVLLNTGSSITSNGGSVTIGGGADPSTTAAFGSAVSEYGVRILGTITAGAGSVSIRGQSLAAAAAVAHGVDISTGGGVTTTSGNITIVGVGGNSTFAATGVNLTKSVSSSADGAISITGTSTGSAANSRGVFISGATAVSTTGAGTLTVSGTASTSVANNGVELNSTGSITSTGSGAITITGAGAGAGSGLSISVGTNRIGDNGSNTYTGAITINSNTVAMSNHSITTTGAGTVTIQPVAAGTAVSLNGASTLDLTATELAGISASTLIVGASGGTGAIGIGSAGALGLGGTNYNLTVRGGAVTFSNGLTLAGAKTATFNTAGITGFAGTEVTSVNGTLVLNTTGAVTMDTSLLNFGASNMSGGAVTVSNTGNLTVSGAVSVLASSALTLTTTGNLTVSNTIAASGALTLTASASTGNLSVNSAITGTAANIALNAGQTLTVAAAVSTTSTNTLSLSGNSGAGARDIVISSGASVGTVDGALSIDADQGSAFSGGFAGVTIAGTAQVTGTGTLTVAGRGSSTGAGAVGVIVQSGGDIIGGTSGAVSITGTGATNSNGSIHGVQVTGAGSSITSTGASVQVTGFGGGNLTGASNFGVALDSGGVISAGGTGGVTVQGTGGANAAANMHGVDVRGSGSAITSTNGAVAVVGTGGGSGGTSTARGVSVFNGGTIAAGGTGTVTVTGTGGAGTGGLNAGVYVATASASITSGGGSVIVTGTAGAGTSMAIDLADSAGSVTTAANGGALTLVGNSMNIVGTVSANGSNTVTLRPGTAGTAINLGAADSAGVLGLTDSELTQVSGGTIAIGSSTNTGGITIGSATLSQGAKTFTFTTAAGIAVGGSNFTAANVTLTADADANGSGAITTAAGVISAGTITATAATGIALNTAATTLSAVNSTSGNINIAETNDIAVTALTTSAGNGSITLATTSGSITTSGAVTAHGSGGVSLTAGGTGSLTAGAAVSSTSGTIALSTAGGLISTGAVTTGSTGTISITAGGAGTVSTGAVTTGTGAITISSNNGAVTTTGAVTTGGAGTITLTASGAGNTLAIGAGVSTGSGTIALTADQMALTGAANSISSTGALTIAPFTASESIGLGSGAAGTLNLTGAEIATFANGFSSITFGAAAGSHAITVDNNGTLTFNDPVTIRTGTAGGSISLSSDTPLAGAGNASLTLTSAGALTLSNSLATVNQNITVSFGTAGGAVNATIGVVNAGIGSATVTGGSGANVVTLTSTANAVTVNGNGGTDTLVAPNAVNTWNISANTLNTNVTHSAFTTLQGGTSTDTFTINASRAQNLKGGAGSDSFVFSNGVTLTGTIDGEAGTDTLNVAAITPAVTVTVTGAGSVDGVAGTAAAAVTGGFDNINTLAGSGTFTGANAASTWAVGPTVTYTTSSRTVTLTGFTALQGGTDVDTFNVTSGHAVTSLAGGSGNDVVNLDFSGGNPAGSLSIDGEGNTDTLTLSGTTATTVAHAFSSLTAGSVTVDAGTASYSGMEVVTDSLGAGNRSFTFNGGAETITLTDAAGANMTIGSTASAALTFANPTTSLTVNAGSGNDTVNVTSLDAAYAGSLTLSGGGQTDAITLSSGLPSLSALTTSSTTLAALPSLAIGAGGLSLTTTGGDITQSGALSVTGTTALNAGANAITLTNSGNNFVGAVSAAATGASGISIDDSTGGITIAAITAVLSTSVNVTATGGGGVTVSGPISAASAAVALNAAGAISLGGNITADTLDLTAGSTIGQSSGSLSTSGALTTISAGAQTLTSATNAVAAFIATNTAAGAAITLENAFNGLEIGPISNNAGPVTIDNTNGAGSDSATIAGVVNSGGTAAGDVLIATDGRLTVWPTPVATPNAVDTKAASESGGVLVLSGAITLNAPLDLGGGDITLQGGAGDLNILAPLTLATSFTLSSTRNVVIEASVTVTGATSDLRIIADSDLTASPGDQGGGVWIKEAGYVSAGHDLTITGSEITDDITTDPGQAIRIDAEGDVLNPVVQVQAVRNITMNSSTAAPANVTALGGYVKNTNTGATVGNIQFSGPVDVIEDTAFVYAGVAGSVLFDSTVDSTNGHDLKLQTPLGNINFAGAVGATDPLGNVTIVSAGQVTAVSTVAAGGLAITALDTVTFQDAVMIDGATGDVFTVHAPTLASDAVSAPGGGNIVWEVDTLNMSTTPGDTVTGVGELTIRPITASRSIALNGTGNLNLTTDEIGQIGLFDLVTIGRTDGSGTFHSNGADFATPINLLTPNGTMTLDGKIATTNTGDSIAIQAKTLNLNVDSAANNALSTQAGSITITNTNIVLQKNTKISTNSGAAGGNVILISTINGAHDFVVDARNATNGGTVAFRGMPVQTASWSSIGGTTRLSSLTVSANNIDTAPHTLTTGDQVYNAAGTMTTHGGVLDTGYAADVTVNGKLNPTENLRILAANVTVTGTVTNDSRSSYQLNSTTTADSATVGVSDTSNLRIGQKVSGDGIPEGATILTIDGPAQITLSVDATETGAGYLTFGIGGAATLTGTADLGTDTFTLTSGNTSGLYIGQPVSGSGIPAGATVASIIDNTTFTISTNVTTFTILGSISGTILKGTTTSGSDVFTLTLGVTGPSLLNKAVTGTNIPNGAVVSEILSPTTFRISLPTSSDVPNPRVGTDSNAALTVTATDSIQFGGNVGQDSGGVGKPLQSIALNSNQTITAGGQLRSIGPIDLTAREIDFNGGVGSVVGSIVTLRSVADSQAVVLGTNGGTPVAAFELDADDIAALGAGIGATYIGRPATAALSIDGPVTFKSPTTIRASMGTGGKIDINADVNATRDTTLSFGAKNIFIGADVTSEDGAIAFTYSGTKPITPSITVDQPAILSSATGNITLTGVTTVSSDLTVTTTTGDVAFAGGTLTLGSGVDLSVTTGSGDVFLRHTVRGTDATNALTFTSTSGNVTLSVIGDGTTAHRVDRVEVNTGGLVTLTSIDAKSIETNGAPSLTGTLRSWGDLGIQIHDPLTLIGNAVIQAKNAGAVDVWSTVQSSGTPRSLWVSTASGALNMHGAIGSPTMMNAVTIGSTTGAVHLYGAVSAAGAVTISSTTGSVTLDAAVGAGRAFTISSTSGTIAINATIGAASVAVKGGVVTATDLITTTGNQSFSGTGTVTLDELTAGGTLTVVSGRDVTSTGKWNITGRASLASTSTSALYGYVTAIEPGNTFGSLAVSGHSVDIVVDGPLNIAGGKVTRVSGTLGTTTLTSTNDSITQTGAFETYKLIANAASAGAKIDFGTGTLRVAELGALTANSDITIVRGAPSNLHLMDHITSATGNIIIVGDYGSSKANVENDLAGNANPIHPGAGQRFLIYAYSRSTTTTGGLLTGISAQAYNLPTAFQPLRYSAASAAGISGSYFVFAHT